MRTLTAITDKYNEQRPLLSKTILLCTHAKNTAVKLSNAILNLGGNLFFYPVEYSQDLNAVASLRKNDKMVYVESRERRLKK